MQNKLILRSTNSPFSGDYIDINKGSVLSHRELDGNFIYLKGETIYTATTSGSTIVLKKLNGDDFTIDVSELNGYIQNLESPNSTISIEISGDTAYIDVNEISAGGVTYNNPAYTALTSVQAALDSLLYVAPDITSFTNNLNTLEIGTTATSVTLNWTLNKAMTSISLNNGIGSIPINSTTYTHSGQSISTNRTYTLTVGDGQNTDTASTSISFQNRRFWGTSPNTTLTNAQILGLQSSELSTTRNQTRNINGNGQYIYFAYPASFGAASFTVNGLPNTAFTLMTQSFTNSQGYTTTYNVYRTNTVQFGTLTITIS